MITRIEIDGFKSFQGFALDLEPFTALIGPNGAGKSNLLDALSLLPRIATSDLATAFGEGRGRIRDQFARSQGEPAAVSKGFGPLARTTLAVELLLRPTVSSGLRDVPLQATRLRYEVEIELHQLPPMRQEFKVVREGLRSLPSSADAWVTRHPTFRPFARYRDGDDFLAYGERGSDLTVDDPSAPELAIKDVTIQYPPHEAFLSRSEVQARSPHLEAVAEELRGLRILHLEARKLREPSEQGAPPVLTADGANLSAVLAARKPAVIAQIRADLASLIPGVRTFEIVAEGDTLLVEIESSDGQRFPARVLSDGTLRILALSTLLRASTPGAVIAIEEPENGLHPMRVRLLIDRLLSATTSHAAGDEGATGRSPQVLITSHSPVVLAALMDHPECIVALDLVRQGTGLRHTRARTVAPPGVIERGQYVSSGELRRILEMANPAEIGEP